MPVQKFRDVADLPEAHVYEPGDPALVDAIRRVWATAQLACPLRFPPGVYRHRTIEAANAQQEAWEADNVAAQRSRRGSR